MPRRANPDYVVDADRGSGSARAKVAEILTMDEHLTRADSRAGLRELDALTEMLGGLTRQQRDKERISPRRTVADLGHPRMQRPLPAAGDTRVPFSSRQKKARSKTRIVTHVLLPDTQVAAQRRLVTDPGRWRQVNDALSEHVGDIQALPDAEQRELRRVDRSIQAYERRNTRGHVLYANVRMPYQINHSNLQAFVERNFQPDDEIAFDRYTAATHQLHETTAKGGPDSAGRVAVFEIQTRRGAYLGHSDSRDETSHLLPRGMQLRVVGTGWAPYTAPDGSTGTRMVIQLRDVTPEPAHP